MNIGMNHVFCFNRFLVYKILKRATITRTKQLPTCCKVVTWTNFWGGSNTSEAHTKHTAYTWHVSNNRHGLCTLVRVLEIQGAYTNIYKPIFGHLPCLCLKIRKQTCCHPHWRQPNISKYLVKMLMPVCLRGPFETLKQIHWLHKSW